MQKFDNILKKYIVNEGGESITLNTSQIEDATKKMASDPNLQKLGTILTAQADALDPDKIHKGLNSVIDPKNPLKFSDAFSNPSDQASALEHLKAQGIPIANAQANQNDQQKNVSDQQKPQTQSIKSSTNASAPSSYGSNLQGI